MVLLVAGLAITPRAALAQDEAAAQPEHRSDVWVSVTRFDFRYAAEIDGTPSLDGLGAVTVPLSRTAEGWVEARPELGVHRRTIADLAAETQAERFNPGAVNAVAAAVTRWLHGHGIYGATVRPDAAQLDAHTGEDHRPGETGALTLVIGVPVIAEVRSTGKRWPSEIELKNDPRHARFRDGSPLGPPGAGHATALFNKPLLEAYIARLNRRRDRQVHAVIGPGEEPGEAVLEFDIREEKPWTVYFSLSNTGTRQTSMWRERFGFIHRQLTGHDDILSVAYATADFDAANAVSVSYERPIDVAGRMRWRVYGSWNEFTASDVGFGDDEFSGDGWSLGGELIREVYHDGRALFVDAFAGVRWDQVHTNNTLAGLEGESGFFLPTIGLRLEEAAGTSTMMGSIALEAGFASAGDEQVERLGRTAPDGEWLVLRGEVARSIYLEPLFLGDAWYDPEAPASLTTLAHELIVSVRGQAALGHRLIPQAEEVAGGMYSVRGYPEAAVAGDSVVVGSLEYQFHLPRLLGVQPAPTARLLGEPFRWHREHARGLPDWDLIGRAFLDAGRTMHSDAFSFEQSETLLGAGVGVELKVKQNVSVRADFGWALSELESVGVSAGSSRVHFGVTVSY